MDSLRIEARMVEGRTLTKTKEIVQAVFENRPLVARTEFDTENGNHYSRVQRLDVKNTLVALP